MLTSGTTRPVGVNSKISRIDVDLYIIINLGIGIDRGKRGMSTVTRIKWRFSDQPMDAGLSSQITECIFTIDLDGCTFYACNLSFGVFNNRR